MMQLSAFKIGNLVVLNRKLFNEIAILVQVRVILLFSAVFYALTLHYAHRIYLFPVWEYFGFTYQKPDEYYYILLGILIVWGALFIPAKLDRASSIILLLLFTVVYVPTVVLTPLLAAADGERYIAILCALAISFSFASISVSVFKTRLDSFSPKPGKAFTLAILCVWAVSCGILLSLFWPIMSFVGLGDIYEQRAAGASTSLAIGYIQTYFGNVLSPALISIGLTRKKWGIVLIGIAGCLIMYMINAQRSVFLMPVAIISLYFFVKGRRSVYRSAPLIMIGLGIAVLLSVSYRESNVVAAVLSTYLVFRTLAIPGLTYSQYYELFASTGFTNWSHVRGVDIFASIPSSFRDDPFWPHLGHIIGDRIYNNSANNVNANLFSGDGIAAAGVLGVYVMGLLLATWLVILDRATRGWSQEFAILVALPMGLALTNGSLFTVLLSFGGLFWLLVFYFCKPRSAPVNQISS